MSKNIYRVPRWVKKRIETELYQYYDNKELLKEFEEDILEESSYNDGQPRGNETSDTTAVKATKLADRSTRVLIETERRLRYIENAIKKLNKDEKQIFEYIEVKYDINFKLSLIKSPSVYQRKIDVFTEREKNRIKTYCLNSPQEKDIGVLIALFSGIRIGELCGLKWGDIDFENKSINIKRTIQRIYEIEKGTRVVETLPKTATSLRIIPLSNILYTKLKNLSKKHKKEDKIISGVKKIGVPQINRYK